MPSDFIDDMANHLEAKFTLFDSFSVDVLPEDLNAITIRRTPAAPLERYLDDSRDWIIAFQILVKHQNQGQAIDTMNQLTIYLDELGPNAVTSADGSYQFIKSEIYTMPLLVEKDSRGSYIYSALFNATITKN
ncbi:minor capsid protein [Cytobacillus firmus]|uniref:minor capsid protein n=1 Tax=Cytobacillus firmus TaxID=1399 RepID=UPI00216385D0|nr:minor capsid protein [Cytobacillus firmus]MCS0652026.1 minor capsid protein [Cytobacillus firmus]